MRIEKARFGRIRSSGLTVRPAPLWGQVGCPVSCLRRRASSLLRRSSRAADSLLTSRRRETWPSQPAEITRSRSDAFASLGAAYPDGPVPGARVGSDGGVVGRERVARRLLRHPRRQAGRRERIALDLFRGQPIGLWAAGTPGRSRHVSVW